jgi:anionic cell wall polymer biosynthesis LytR-Cps2A-Psr (LCP) family protein
MAIAALLNSMTKPNKKLVLKQVIDEIEVTIESNYNRELLYNLEHCIHHQALIKVAVLQMKYLQIDENFGVARSTIEYRKQCAQ